MSGMYQMRFLPASSSCDRIADAAFELADVHLAGHEVGAARLEHAPSLGRDTFRKQPQERRLADVGLAGDQQRAQRRLTQRRFGDREALAPVLRLDQQFELALVAPEPADRRQDACVDFRSS